MKNLFTVIRRRGPAWDSAQPLEGQGLWREHADFMNALHRDGFIVLAGPRESLHDALLIVRAESPEEIVTRLAADPWTASGHLVTGEVARWDLRIGSL
jgi:uncharacterized protein YciI